MPEHAAVDTSIFNEWIPQALQQTLYTKISNVQKGRKLHSCHFATHKYIYWGSAGRSTCSRWNGFHSLLSQFRKIGDPMTSGKHIHNAIETLENQRIQCCSHIYRREHHIHEMVSMCVGTMSPRNKTLSASCHTVSFQSHCSSVSCPQHHPCWVSFCVFPRQVFPISLYTFTVEKITTQ